MPIDVTDVRSNPNEQIEYAAKRIGKAGTRRRKVFDAIYKGKKNPKTVDSLAEATGLSRKDVLDAGKHLVDTLLVGQTKVGSQTAYTKFASYKRLRNQVQNYADNPKKLKKLPTKYKPNVKVSVKVGKTAIPKRLVKIKLVTIDDLEQFSKVKKIKRLSVAAIAMAENKFKKGIQKLLGEKGKFQDWGGESNDLLTTRVKLNGHRVAAAFALKGRGKKGILTPAGMGKNGDQIPHLFRSPVTFYALQYWNQIGEAVYEMMKTYATVRSIQGAGESITYAVIDGQDSARIIKAYPKAFK